MNIVAVVIFVIVALDVGFLFGVVWNSGAYDRGYHDGYDEGFREGFNDGLGRDPK